MYLECPRLCGGEKVLEENRTSWNDALRLTGGDKDKAYAICKWSPEDGYVIVPEDSCECKLTPEEEEALQVQALENYMTSWED